MRGVRAWLGCGWRMELVVCERVREWESGGENTLNPYTPLLPYRLIWGAYAR